MSKNWQILCGRRSLESRCLGRCQEQILPLHARAIGKSFGAFCCPHLPSAVFRARGILLTDLNGRARYAPKAYPMNIAVVVPVLNASREWLTFSGALDKNIQLLGIPRDNVLIIDSSSADRTPELVRNSGFRLHTISRSDFDHGATRQLALEIMKEADVFVYLTQDAVLAKQTSIQCLLQSFADPQVGASYGRQLPRIGAGAIEAHARIFNYPDFSCVRNLDSRNGSGLKSIFLSNSFSAYRRGALESIGGFPGDVIFGEDTIACARLHLRDWKTAYIARSEEHTSELQSLRH